MKLSQSRVGIEGLKPSTRFLGQTHSVELPALSVTVTRAKSPSIDCMELSARESDGQEYCSVESGTPLWESEMLTLKVRFQGVQYQSRNVTSCPGVQVWVQNPVVLMFQFPQEGGVLSIRRVGEVQVLFEPFLLNVTLQVSLSEFTMHEALDTVLVEPLLFVYVPHRLVKVTEEFHQKVSPVSYVPDFTFTVQLPQSMLPAFADWDKIKAPRAMIVDTTPLRVCF